MPGTHEGALDAMVPALAIDTQTVAVQPEYVAAWRQEQRFHFEATVFFICVLIGIILASFAWRGD